MTATFFCVTAAVYKTIRSIAKYYTSVASYNYTTAEYTEILKSLTGEFYYTTATDNCHKLSRSTMIVYQK